MPVQRTGGLWAGPRRSPAPPAVPAPAGWAGLPSSASYWPPRQPMSGCAAGRGAFKRAGPQRACAGQHGRRGAARATRGGARRSPSFLSDDGAEGSVCPGVAEAGPLCSTRRSLLQELGGGCGLGEPPALSIPSLTPQRPPDPWGSALPPQPLASSTMLSAGDEPGEGPSSWTWGGRMGGPRWALPEPSAGDHPSPSPHSGSSPAGAGGWDRSSLGDSSGDTECFISAVETLEPSEAGGCPGARHRWSPCPMAAGGLELGEAPSPTRAAAWELPPTRPPNAERARGEDLGGRSRVAPRCGGGSDVGDGGELLAQLQGCSLRGSPPATPGPLCSPASVSAGNVTPHGQDPPRDRHVTPRTKSRLQASAARLSASPSSPLFHEPLEVPRRPPRLRAPRGVPRDPAATLGHHVTPRGERGRGTGSLGDTEILLRAPSLPQGAGGSPGSSPTALLCRGDHGHPQGPPCATGSPNPGVLEGGSEWQDPSPLGTPQLPWLHRSLSRLLAPRLPGSTAAELGGRAVPLLPAGCSTRFSEEHLEDEEREQAPSPEGTAGVQDGRTCPVPPRRLSDEALRRRLRALGDNPGPVTELTRRLYLRRLEKLGTAPSWWQRCRPATSPTVPRTSWCPGSSTAPTGVGAGGKGWSSPASTTSSSTPEPAAPLPPSEPGRVLQDLRQSHLLRGQGDTRPPVLSPHPGAEPAPRRDAEGLPQGAAHPGDLGERAGCRLRALLPGHRPGGGLHAGGLPRGGPGAADHHQPAEGALLRRGGQLAGPTPPAPGRPHAAQGHAHLPGRGRAAAPAGRPGRALSTPGGGGGVARTPPARRPRSGCGFYVVNAGEEFPIFLFP
ncbi:LOW QUALITY PROTEIN: uncharacterized protein O9250_012499 [Rhynochetos jubatus]